MSRLPRLNRLLELEEDQRTPDGAGGYSTEWVGRGTHWAELRPGYGRQREEADASLASVRYRIITRASPSNAPSRPRPGQRFRDGDRTFVIQAVSEFDSDARYLTCFSTEEIST